MFTINQHTENLYCCKDTIFLWNYFLEYFQEEVNDKRPRVHEIQTSNGSSLIQKSNNVVLKYFWFPAKDNWLSLCYHLMFSCFRGKYSYWLFAFLKYITTILVSLKQTQENSFHKDYSLIEIRQWNSVKGNFESVKRKTKISILTCYSLDVSSVQFPTI